MSQHSYWTHPTGHKIAEYVAAIFTEYEFILSRRISDRELRSQLRFEIVVQRVGALK